MKNFDLIFQMNSFSTEQWNLKSLEICFEKKNIFSHFLIFRAIFAFDFY